MIRFDLICDSEHAFDGWFSNGDAFEEQKKDGYVTCPYCGSQAVEKQLMVPSIPAKSNKAAGNERDKPMLSVGQDPAVKALAENIRQMRRTVEENAEYVGKDFARKAREIHYEEKPARGIYGEASVDDAKSLLEEGVDVMPLPTLPEENN